jgi:integrase
LIATVRKADGARGRKCADFIEFLAYSGCRKGEAARVEGRQCDFEKGEIAILGDPVTGTKDWENGAKVFSALSTLSDNAARELQPGEHQIYNVLRAGDEVLAAS